MQKDQALACAKFFVQFGLISLTVLALFFIASELKGETFPYANFDAGVARDRAVDHPANAYSTTLVINNPTSEPVTVPDFWRPFGVGGGEVTIQPHSTFRMEGWPREGGGVVSFDVPDELVAYVDVRDPFDQLAPIFDLGAPIVEGAPVQLMDLYRGEGFSTYLFLHAPEGSVLTVERWAEGKQEAMEQYVLRPGETIIPLLALGTTRAVVSVGSRVGFPGPRGPVYAFALISHSASRGEQFAVMPLPLQ